MTRRVSPIYRIICTIGIPVECLGIMGLPESYRIRRDEPSQLRIIIACTEVDKPGFVVGFLAGEVVPGDFFTEDRTFRGGIRGRRVRIR